MKTEYTCGFMFSYDFTKVALIHKKHGPDCVVGKLNGIGGKVEEKDYENPNVRREAPPWAFAQAREFREEAGAWVPADYWKEFAMMRTDDALVHFFRSRWVLDEGRLRTMTDEPVAWYDVQSLLWPRPAPEFDGRPFEETAGYIRPALPLAPNLSWLIPAALNRHDVRHVIQF